MTTCRACGAQLRETDRYCIACDTPNVGGTRAPKFRPRASDLPPVDEPAGRSARAITGFTCPRCGFDDVALEANFCPICGMDLTQARRTAAMHRDQATGVWMTPGPRNVDPYRPLRHLTWLLGIALVVLVGLLAAWGTVQLVLFARLNPALPTPPMDADRTRELMNHLAIASAIAAAVALVVTIGWTSRAHRNLSPLSVAGLRFGPTAVVLVWIAPVVNLVLPKLVLDEVWRASAPDEPPGTSAWRRLAVPFYSTLGWGVLMAGATGAILAYLGAAADRGSDVAGLRLVLLMGAASAAASVLGILLLGLLVSQIAERQRERVDVLGPPDFVIAHGDRWAANARVSTGNPELDQETSGDDLDEPVEAPAADGTRPTPASPGPGPKPGVVWGRY